jgi:hypothetical protein
MNPMHKLLAAATFAGALFLHSEVPLQANEYRECHVVNEECIEYFDESAELVYPGCGIDGCGLPCPGLADNCCYTDCVASPGPAEWCTYDLPPGC